MCVESAYIVTENIDRYSAQIRLELDFVNYKNGGLMQIDIISPEGEILKSESVYSREPKTVRRYDIENPRLWYPLGYGEHPIYSVRVTLGENIFEDTFGIRTVKILQIEDKKGSKEEEYCNGIRSFVAGQMKDNNEKTSGFQVVVNGKKILAMGGNWVPCDPFTSEVTPDRYEMLVERAAQMNLNMLRVWGGGQFEDRSFFDACDRAGIMITQDFLMACGHYPEDEDWFIDALRREAHAAALRLRNHACLAFWTGDNENAEWGDENRTDFPGYRSATFGIEPVISRLDPERYFFPSSPYGGNRYSSATRGTTHGTNYMFPMFVYIDETDMSDYRKFFSQFIFRFNTEQPVFGMSFASCLEKYLDKEDIYGESTELLEYHSKTNPYLKHTLFELNEMMAQKIFGRFEDGADRLLKLQMIQCEWTRISLELFRRYKGFSSGIIYWMLNDCWPASAGWSFIDYYACPKPSYYAFKRCAAKALVMLSESDGVLSLHVGNDSLEALTGSASLYVYDTANGRELCRREIDFSLKPNCTESVFECDYEEFAKNMNENCVILCDALSTLGDDRAILVPKRYSDLKVGYSDWRVIYENEEKITVEADGFTPFVMIDSPYLLSDNCFILKKGERRTVKKIRRL
jgi:beta-mannosidase